MRRAMVMTTLLVSTATVIVGADTLLGGQVLPTTLEDFFQPGSQPTGGVAYAPFVTSQNCRACHEEDPAEGTVLEVYPKWRGSMMAQAARDPLFYACLAIANQDAEFAGDLCIRCHTPGGWISGRSEPTDGSALTAADRDGISCSVCHRLVDPLYEPGVSPPIDETILGDLDSLPPLPGGGAYVLDPEDRRRGPYDDINSAGHIWVPSPLNSSADMCATCHDVSNPVYVRQPDDTYALSDLDEPHPTGNKYDQFPIERTYSEWLMSDYPDGVDAEGRFGGLIPDGVVRTCQDCHMPTTQGKGCRFPDAPVRSDLKAHDFAGGNAWVQQMVLNLYPDDFDDADVGYLQDGMQRSREMLQLAATLDLSQIGNHLNVRIYNETGHKLPSGYPEGRRMWINVQFSNGAEQVIAERGFYDALNADLSVSDTKVYEVHLGVGQAVSQMTGIPVGESFHFAVNNVILKDNRIPPRGFERAAFKQVQAAPVAAFYDDGQYWDDTRYLLPAGAASATVRLYYQTASKEFITFLRDENYTTDDGDVLFEQWEATGKSPPVLMATETIELAAFPDGDADGSGTVDLDDYAVFAMCTLDPLAPGCASLDFDADGDVDLLDFGQLQVAFDQ